MKELLFIKTFNKYMVLQNSLKFVKFYDFDKIYLILNYSNNLEVFLLKIIKYFLYFMIYIPLNISYYGNI